MRNDVHLSSGNTCLIGVLAAALSVTSSAVADQQTPTDSPAVESRTPEEALPGAAQDPAPKLKLLSANVLAFGPDAVLFVGDTANGAVHALKTEGVTSDASPAGYNLRAIDRAVADYLGVEPNDLVFHDLAVHPVTKEAYVAVMRGHGSRAMPVIVVVTQNGSLRTLNLKDALLASLRLSRPYSKNFSFYDRMPVSNLSITDIEYHNGHLYVAGLSNAGFPSTLRRVPYPFHSEEVVVSVEIYHANHNQNETRAPIRTLEIVTLDGEEYLLAAFTCTPLVTIPLREIKDGAHVVGKTIADLGYGNTPIDLIQYTAQDMQKNSFDVVFLSNKNQSAQVVALADVAASTKGKSLASFAGFQFAGTKFTPVPMTGLLHVDNQDDYRLLTLRRNLDDGSLELFSTMKNLYFRVSDFESEYEFPDYEYGPNQDFPHQVQDMLKKDEGFENLVNVTP